MSSASPRPWRRGSDDSESDLGELAEGQGEELVRRSAQTFRDLDGDGEPVSAETAEIEDDHDDDHEDVVVEVARWTEPARSAEDCARLEALRAAADAAADAATERVIAQAIATGMTDPDELPQVRRGLLRRKSGYYSPASPRPAVDTAPPAQEARLPRKVRRELDRATRQMAEAARTAHAARQAAEQAASEHAQQTARAEAAATQAVRGRAAAERAAQEQAAQARAEAQRRTVAEQLASETAEQVAAANADRARVVEEARRQAAAAEAAHHARAQAEEAARRASVEREAAEADARAAAEAAAQALTARFAAETRAQELANSLEEARAALLEQTKATIAAEQARAAAPPAVAAPAPEPAPEPTPEPTPAPARPAAPQATPASRPPEPKIQPDGVPELVEFRSPSSSAVITVLLGLGALVAAGVAVYQAYLDQLTTTPGIVASSITLLLVIVVGRSKGSAGQVWLEQGVLHVDEGDSHRRFDLTTPNTKVEMVGQPGERRWKVLFLRKGMAPYEINARLVDPDPFVEALKPWRPRLGR